MEQMAGMDTKERAEYIRAIKAEAMANGQLHPDDYDSEEDDHLF